MLFLKFRIGKDRYVLDARQVEAVLPLVAAKALPGAPAGVAGLISYHGEPVPLIDLALMATGRPVAEVMSSRIILLHRPDGDPEDGSDGGVGRLALAAEEVVDTVKRPAADFVPTGIEAGMAGYLGPVAADGGELVQWVRPSALLTPELRAVLSRAGAEAGSGAPPAAARPEARP